MAARDLLKIHNRYSQRRTYSLGRISEFQQDLAPLLSEHRDVAVFAAGSFGRLEAGPQSDLDLFLISDSDAALSRLQETRLLAGAADVNDRLGFPPLSGDMLDCPAFHRQGSQDTNLTC